MKIEYKIGRDVAGEHIITVPSNCKKVGRLHVSLLWDDGVVNIIDNESKNGTFVNGRRIAKTRVQENDIVLLGGKEIEDGIYQLNLKQIFESCRKLEKACRTDFSNEFKEIKQAYIDYKREEAELKKIVTIKSQMPMRIVSFVPTLIGAVIVLLPGADPNARIIAISVGGAITGLINIFLMGKSAGTTELLEEKILDLKSKYQPKYCCPKCGMQYPLTMHWKTLKNKAKCPNPKCNAVFFKNNEI